MPLLPQSGSATPATVRKRKLFVLAGRMGSGESVVIEGSCEEVVQKWSLVIHPAHQ